ncbi:hypothetical protein BX600DRAFT_463220, partial [Xylariales sp. PMI_506]
MIHRTDAPPLMRFIYAHPLIPPSLPPRQQLVIARYVWIPIYCAFTWGIVCSDLVISRKSSQARNIGETGWRQQNLITYAAWLTTSKSETALETDYPSSGLSLRRWLCFSKLYLKSFLSLPCGTRTAPDFLVQASKKRVGCTDFRLVSQH